MKHKDLNKWGRDTAKARYSGSATIDDHPQENNLQSPQDPQDKHEPGYDNDVPADWLRGMGKGEAEGKPCFDKGNAWRGGKLRED